MKTPHKLIMPLLITSGTVENAVKYTSGCGKGHPVVGISRYLKVSNRYIDF